LIVEHRPLGRTGVSVSKLGLGAMMFGARGERDHGEATRIIHAALDGGIDIIDTGDVYSGGESELIVGKALAGGRRDDVFLATKVWGPMGDGPHRRGASLDSARGRGLAAAAADRPHRLVPSSST
jgi:aryl-alcohol dehydrogenase-like predicted oxidoreductase